MSGWISEQTAIISLYSTKLFVFIREAECLLRGTNWVLNQTDTVSSLKYKIWHTNLGTMNDLDRELAKNCSESCAFNHLI